MFADLILEGRFKVRIHCGHSQFYAKFLHIMEKVTILWVLLSAALARPVFGRIYFTGLNYPPSSEETTKSIGEVVTPNSNSAQSLPVASVESRYQIPSEAPPPSNYQPQPAASAPSNYRPQPAASPPSNYRPQPAASPPSNYQPHPAASPPSNHQPQPAAPPPSNYQPHPAASPPSNHQPQPAAPPPSNYQPQPAASPPTNYRPMPVTSSPHLPPSRPFHSASSSEYDLKRRLQKNISRGVTQMTLQLQKLLGGKRNNIVFSPVSIASALALLLLGAKGETAKQIANLLGFADSTNISNRKELVHQQLGKFFTDLENGTSHLINSELAFASGIFVQDGVPIKPQYRSIATTDYKSEVQSLDFKRNDALLAINNWVSNRTNGRITSVLEESLPTSTVAVLANAIYFNGNWEYPFYTTSLLKFYVAPKETITIPMMSNNAKVPFLMDNQAGFKMVGLPYKGGDNLMYAVIPDGDLDTFIGTLTPERIYDMINRTEEEMTIIIFPKMKLEMETNLLPPLFRMGVKDVFHPSRADLSSLADGVSISKAIHKAEIDVNEVGTIASAFTITSLIRTNTYPTFVANKPFLFFIYHKPTQAITFWSSVYKPKAA